MTPTLATAWLLGAVTVRPARVRRERDQGGGREVWTDVVIVIGYPVVDVPPAAPGLDATGADAV